MGLGTMLAIVLVFAGVVMLIKAVRIEPQCY